MSNETPDTFDTFPVTCGASGRAQVDGWQGERLKLARESRGFTRSELARLCAANGMKSLNTFRIRLYEDEPKAAPTPEEAKLLARITDYPAAFFIQPIPEEVRAFGEEARRVLFARYSRVIICDVCEQERGDDDVRAHHQCDACKRDLCVEHHYAYEVEVALPHGGQRKVVAASYCPKCYRRFVSSMRSSVSRTKPMKPPISKVPIQPTIPSMALGATSTRAARGGRS